MSSNGIENMVSAQTASNIDIRMPSINLAIGPSCPVRCEGCHNYFGETFINQNLVSGDEVIDFAHAAAGAGIHRAVISGGDPLSHPQIQEIVTGLHDDLGFFVRLDTVGTSFLPQDSRIVYKGSGVMPKHDIARVATHVNRIHIPLDGASKGTALQFRKGRVEQFNETLVIASMLRVSGVSFGINSVGHAGNIDELPEMHDIISNTGASEWRLFEYDPEGPNPSKRRDRLSLEDGKFEQKVKDLLLVRGGLLKVVPGVLRRKLGAFFMVDDAGIAYRRRPGQDPIIEGHITRDRHKVLSALVDHIDNFIEKPVEL